MGSNVRDLYSVAINGRGYMLRGTPSNPAYKRDEVPTLINRFAISDLDYSSFAGTGYFFTAQTDWSGGIKDNPTWKDDARYFFSTNIDAFSEPGAFKLAKKIIQDTDLTQEIYCGSYETVAGSSFKYIGTKYGSGNKPRLYRYATGSWSDIISGYIPANNGWVTDAMSHKDKLWVTVVGDAATTTYAVFSAAADGTGQTDYSAAIATAMGWTAVTGATAVASDGNTLYVAVQQYGSSKFGIVKTVDNGANWVKLEEFAYDGIIADMHLIGDNLFYLIEKSASYELRSLAVTLVTPVSVSINNFYSSFSSVAVKSAASRRLFFELKGKLIATIPDSEIVEFNPDTSELKSLLKRDSFKYTTLAAIAGESSFVISLPGSFEYKGGIKHNGLIWWGNLNYDGEVFHNTIKNDADTANTWAFPILSDGSNMSWVKSADKSVLYIDDTNYKPTLASNYLVFSQLSQVVSIDKLLHSITILFDPLRANEQIAVEYLTGELTASSTWTALTTMTSVTEGTKTKREFILPGNITYNKLWIRIKMGTATALTTTPVVRDVIIAYKPIPDFKNRWQMSLEMSDAVQLLDGNPSQLTGADLLAQLRNEKNTKQTVNFEDVDYIECTLQTTMTSGATSASVNGTNRFPRQGRIRAVSGGVAEEMIYTSANPKSILGISRGQRGTRARAYLSGQVLKNDYSVLVDQVHNTINFTDEKKTENIAQVVLLEA